MSTYPEEVQRLVEAAIHVNAFGGLNVLNVALEPFLRDCEMCFGQSRVPQAHRGVIGPMDPRGSDEWVMVPCPNPDCIDGKVIA